MGDKSFSKKKTIHVILMLIIDFALCLMDYRLYKNYNPNSQKGNPTTTSVILD